jgi:hypothetical protein
MSKGTYEIFDLVINFVNENWQLKKVTIGFFEAIKTIGQALVRNLRKLLDSYGVRKKIIVYVKDERANLNFMTTTFKFVVNCEILGLEESFNGICFSHAFSKPINMLLLKKGYAKILSLSQSSLCNLISRNV